MTVALLAAGYLAGYAWAFRYLLAAGRRAYADRKSDFWDYTGEKLDGMIVAAVSLGVFLIPLVWPLVAVAVAGRRLLETRPSP
jgi:hypothetical protein